ncbi:MAG TPA: MFS transporter [Reyranella sp.]
MADPEATAPPVRAGDMGAADTPPLRAAVRLADRLVLPAVFVALFMSALEQTIVGPALPSIGRSLGDAYLVPWVAAAFLLAATAMGPIFGAFADNAGRRPALIVALILFVGGSVASALAPSMMVLIVARAVQGLGAGGLVSLPYIVIGDHVPMSRRATFSAFISTLYAVASIGGPPLGGVLTQYAHWSLIFWINLPLGLIVLAVVLMQSKEPRQESHRRSDFLGAFLLLAASTTTIETLQFAASANGFEFLPVATATAAAAGWALFGWRMRTAANPLLPVGILVEPTILLCTLGLLCTHGANLGLALYLPFYYQQVLGLDVASSGIALLGFVGALAIGAYLPAAVLGRTRRYKAMSVAAAIVAVIGSIIVMAALRTSTSLLIIELATAVMGFGVGGLYPTFTIATQNAASRVQMGAATGLLAFTRSMGGAVGVTATGMIASATGLTGGLARMPVWLLGGVSCLLLAICLVAMALLPVRRLDDQPA